ncbi:MAG TPA: iron-sulfur cluster assembly scaffold protein, partial [Terriglobales bacterium]|nr:iron-sulfur cluster assembly scaffold protein [Terriglobales bacterium]
HLCDSNLRFASSLKRPMYSPQLIDHFQHPRNAGIMESPDVSVQAENPACGDVMKLMLRVRDGRIVDAKYQVRGCVASIAAGSALTEAIAGKSVVEAAALRRAEIVEALGGLPSESMHASHLAMASLKLALTELKR